MAIPFLLNSVSICRKRAGRPTGVRPARFCCMGFTREGGSAAGGFRSFCGSRCGKQSPASALIADIVDTEGHSKDEALGKDGPVSRDAHDDEHVLEDVQQQDADQAADQVAGAASMMATGLASLA